MKFVITNISTKDIFYDKIEDAETAFNNLKDRNPNVKLVVDFENSKILSQENNSTLRCLCLASNQDVTRDEVQILSEGCKRTFKNNMKAIKIYLNFIKKNYFPELILNNKRIAAEYINTGKLAGKKYWDEA